jgi:hypothetical protein
MPVLMVAPAHRPMPELKRFRSHRMEIPSTRDVLEMKLVDWIQQVLDYIGQSAAMDGVHPATYLTANADGIDTIMHAPTAMNLDLRTVYADFALGQKTERKLAQTPCQVRTPSGPSTTKLTEADRRALKDRLIDQAETENAAYYHARQARWLGITVNGGRNIGASYC